MNKIMAKEWLKASLDDLKVIQKIIDVKDLTHIVAFHSQQSVEKSIKALLEYQNKNVPKIHHISKLISSVEETISYDSDLVKLLDSLYIDSRYPGDMGLLPYGKPSLEDAKEFYEFAQGIFDDVCEVLEIEKELFYE